MDGHAGSSPAQLAPSVATAGGPESQLAKRHGCELGANASTGQLAALPVQFSATSHTPAELRQTVELEANPSVGQLALLPGQLSTTSQGPALERQVPPEAKPSAGQFAVPLQFSATSQAPADGRHTTEPG